MSKRKVFSSSLAAAKRADAALYELYDAALRGTPIAEWDKLRALLHDIDPVIAAVIRQREIQQMYGKVRETETRFNSVERETALGFFGE